MMDVSRQIRAYASAKNGWLLSRSMELAQVIARYVKGRVDWDEGAGESWCQVVVDRKTFAFVSMAGPLILMLSAGQVSSSSFPDVEVITLPTLDRPVLTASRQVLEEAFGVEVLTAAAFDAKQFSAEELWFVTV